MNLRHLGEQIDIHGGGNDLIFPHHENEIAQTESLTGKPFARYWVHNGMMQLAGQKMSKSLGNLVTIEDFLAHHEGDALRMMVLNSSYHNPLTFGEDVIAQAESALERLRNALRPAPTGGEASSELQLQIDTTQRGFEECMDDDFNTAGALGHLFDLVRAINQARDTGVDPSAGQTVLRELMGVLGLQPERPTVEGGQAAPFIDLLVEIRRELRKQKLWVLSDLIRDRLTALNVVIEDTKDGTTWRWK
jgi:cysteinyl-tRNA synthetase